MTLPEARASASSRWDDERFVNHLENLVWTSSSIVRRYLHELISGSPTCDWVTWVEFKHLAPRLDRALVVGCGSGWLDRAVAARGRFRSIVACDIAEATIERARTEAARQELHQIEYRTIDLENVDLDGPYDAIFANDVLHHVTDLEGTFEKLHSALAPEGKLLFNEYVGPNRFQYSDDRMDLVNRYFRLFPDELRREFPDRQISWRRDRMPAEEVIKADPTEAVRSEDVLPIARRVFKIEREYEYGGGLLNPLLYGVVINFDEEQPEHRNLLEVLCGTEARLMACGAIPSDFAVMVASRRD